MAYSLRDGKSYLSIIFRMFLIFGNLVLDDSYRLDSYKKRAGCRCFQIMLGRRVVLYHLIMIVDIPHNKLGENKENGIKKDRPGKITMIRSNAGAYANRKINFTWAD